MGSPGARGRTHLWRPIPVPAGEPADVTDEVTFDACTCGAQRRTTSLPRSVVYAYRPKPSGRWQMRATGCGRLPAVRVRASRARASTGGVHG